MTRVVEEPIPRWVLALVAFGIGAVVLFNWLRPPAPVVYVKPDPRRIDVNYKGR